MKESELKELSVDELTKKLKNHKVLIGISLGLVIVYVLFSIKDYLNGIEIDSTMSIIMICCLGGVASLFPEMKAIQKELASR